MSSIQLVLEGGPHHDKPGWFSDAQPDAPTILYVTTHPDYGAMIFADVHHPFAEGMGPFAVYRLAGLEPDMKTRLYIYDEATEAP